MVKTDLNGLHKFDAIKIIFICHELFGKARAEKVGPPRSGNPVKLTALLKSGQSALQAFCDIL